ncbi:MAG TPA: glycosyltransferase [Xanthobacteraceae bacterium]|nr:glycosyltransferase [Xanthobacteraceae bacterium]
MLENSAGVRGCFDGLDGTMVRGWALDANGSKSALQIHCCIDGVEVGNAIADLFRPDVKAAGNHTESCGFAINIAPALRKLQTAALLSLEASAKSGERVVIATAEIVPLAESTDPIPLVPLASSPGRDIAAATTETASSADFRAGESLTRKDDIVGYFDGLEGWVLRGWAFCREDPGRPVKIQCLVNGKLIGVALAGLERRDVFEAGAGGAYCGFEIDLSKADPLPTNGDPIELTILAGNEYPVTLGHIDIDWTVNAFGFGKVSDEKRRKFASLCLRIIKEASLERAERDREFPFFPLMDEPFKSHRTVGEKYEKLFSVSTVPQTHQSMVGASQLPLSGYLDYVRYRYKVDRAFPVGFEASDVDTYLRWYLDTYSKLRAWRRTPMSAKEIQYLNERSPIERITRAMSYFLPDWRRSTTGILSEAERTDFIYWWVVDLTPAHYVEDILVPRWCVEELTHVGPRWHNLDFPLNGFMERFFAQMEALHFLDMSQKTDRALFYAFLIVNAMKRPDLLRFVPQKGLTQFLWSKISEHDSLGHTFFDLLRVGFGLGEPFFSLARLRNECASRMFDLDRLKFATVSEHGHRIAAAALPLLHRDDAIPLQVIGPFQKASGLGQAARLSVQTIRQAGYTANAFNFGLDNPAPEGLSTPFRNEQLKKSRVNVIHLNAESIPLAFAYLPPVLSESYNIGYFFWELDSPAACHFLSLALLDEIWVASEYCRIIYSQHTTKPVINVGMCAERLTTLPKWQAKEFVHAKFGFKNTDFVFLSVFDSFSFVQRKNPIAVARAFRAAFPTDSNMRLMLKTHNRESVSDPRQEKIWRAVEEEAGADWRITVVNETLSYEELRNLEAGVDCYVSLHRSEGWGFGLIEAMASQTPLIATAYSGNMDFCSRETCWLVDYDEVYLGDADYIFVVPGQKWAEPRFASAVEQMRSVAYSPSERDRRTAAALNLIQTTFSEGAIARRYKQRLDAIFAQLSI